MLVASTSVFGNRLSNHTHTTPSSVTTRQSGSINALSELVLNLLKHRSPLTPPVIARFRRYKTLLRDVGKRRHSTKRRRELLMSQMGRGVVDGFEGSLSMCPTVAKTIKKPPPPPAGGNCVVMEEINRVAQEGTAGDRAVVQERIDEKGLTESGRALGGQKETPFSRSGSGTPPKPCNRPNRFIARYARPPNV